MRFLLISAPISIRAPLQWAIILLYLRDNDPFFGITELDLEMPHQRDFTSTLFRFDQPNRKHFFIISRGDK